jgi:hypothetical protein
MQVVQITILKVIKKVLCLLAPALISGSPGRKKNGKLLTAGIAPYIHL